MSLLFAWIIIGLWSCFVFSEEIKNYFSPSYSNIKEDVEEECASDEYLERLKLELIEHKIRLNEFDKRLGAGIPEIIEDQKKSGLTQEEYIFRFMDSIQTGSPQTASFKSLNRAWFGSCE